MGKRIVTSKSRMMRKASPTAPKSDVVNPCRICGWAEHMAIHQPILTGPRAGQPFGHTYMPVVRAAASIASQNAEEEGA